MWGGGPLLLGNATQCPVFLLLARTGFEPKARNSEMMRPDCRLCHCGPKASLLLYSSAGHKSHTTGINAEFKDFMPCLFITKKDMPRSGLGLCVN
jgi:hypothetical protein